MWNPIGVMKKQMPGYIMKIQFFKEKTGIKRFEILFIIIITFLSSNLL